MFKRIREFLRGESLLDESYNETLDVLGTLQGMVTESIGSLRQTDTTMPDDRVFELDRQINKYQRRTRRRILTHVSVSPSTDINASLVLASIIIDVERIGDYAKNIVELARAHKQRLTAELHEEALSDLEQRVLAGLVDVRRALEDSDIEMARTYVKTHRKYTRLADAVVNGLISGENDLPKGTSVTLALYTRYLKRIESHLVNIVSSVVNPFHRIGFRLKDKSSKAAAESSKKS
ncbi:MAG: hypothetical protein GF341_00170 [candidate division Zixibacteria bacterium]|nr:hypothetical protein [candidate division Zixibacteria bacterium]